MFQTPDFLKPKKKTLEKRKNNYREQLLAQIEDPSKILTDPRFGGYPIWEFADIFEVPSQSKMWKFRDNLSDQDKEDLFLIARGLWNLILHDIELDSLDFNLKRLDVLLNACGKALANIGISEVDILKKRKAATKNMIIFHQKEIIKNKEEIKNLRQSDNNLNIQIQAAT